MTILNLPTLFNVRTRKIGGLRFIWIGRLVFSFCIKKPRAPLQRLPYGSCGHCGGKPEIICAQVGCPMEIVQGSN